MEEDLEEKDVDWKKKYNKLNDLYKKREKTYDGIRKYNRQYNYLKTRVKKLKAEKISLHEQCVAKSQIVSVIKEIFTSDQIRALVNKSTRGYKWSEETIKKAVRMKLACGFNGYKELLQQRIPLPSICTLQKKLEVLHFEEKICEEIFDILKEKIGSFQDERDKDAMIALDKMSINSGTQFDPSTRSFCGYSSLPNNKGEIGKKLMTLIFFTNIMFEV